VVARDRDGPFQLLAALILATTELSGAEVRQRIHERGDVAQPSRTVTVGDGGERADELDLLLTWLAWAWLLVIWCGLWVL